MANPINPISTPPVTRSESVSRIQFRPQGLAENLPQHQSTPSTSVNVSETLQNTQMRLLQFLESQKFSGEILNRLLQLGNMQLEPFLRTILMTRGMARDPQLADRFTKLLKIIETRGHNADAGIKTILDGFDALMDTDTAEVIRQFMAQHPHMRTLMDTMQDLKKEKKQNEILPKKVIQSSASPSKDESDLLTENNSLISPKANQAHAQTLQDLAPILERAVRPILRQMEDRGPEKPASLAKEFLDFAENSTNEFPSNYSSDLFSFVQLRKRGLSTENYLRLSSEVSPARLLAVSIASEKKGKLASAVFEALLSAQKRGLAVSDIIESLEKEVGLTYSPLKTAARVIPFEIGSTTIKEGENVGLEFIALSSSDGIISSEKSSFVIFPQRWEYAGTYLPLLWLPAGIYFVMARGMDKKNRLINLWMKIIVEGKNQQKKENNEKNKNNKKEFFTEKSESDEMNTLSIFHEVPQAIVLPSHLPKEVTPFLGEIVLPLDLAKKNAEDLLIISPADGTILNRQKLLSDRYQHHAVVFRFLADYVETENFGLRHSLLRIKPSDLFVRFNEQIKNFLSDPRKKIDEWRCHITAFFGNLKKLFPQGQQTFQIAENILIGESEKIVSDKNSPQEFRVTGFESEEKKRLASFYSKGAYALAYAGDIRGALEGLSLATVLIPESTNQKAVLGEYLESLRRKFHDHLSDTAMRNVYGTHMAHSYTQELATNLAHKDLGEAFISVANISPPQLSEPQNTKHLPSPYKK